MSWTAISGWGKCLPPAIMGNDDLAQFLDTSDEWITTRTGMKERRISHVGTSELAAVAGARALACAGLCGKDIDLVVVATCTADSNLPSVASLVQCRIEARHAACYDINAACTGFMHALSAARGMLCNGLGRRALVVGADCMSQVVPWMDRSLSVLFGDGAGALVLEQSERKEGILGEALGCMAHVRHILEMRYGCHAPGKMPDGPFDHWRFDGPDIFKKAVTAMGRASRQVVDAAGVQVADIDLCVPHQANKRIIDAVAGRIGLAPERSFCNVHRYANTTAGTIPIALTEALEQGLVKPGARLLMPSFGAGLTWSAHYVLWGERTSPLDRAQAELPPCDRTGLELVEQLMADRGVDIYAGKVAALGGATQPSS